MASLDELTIVNGAMAMDGGSIHLAARDRCGDRIRLRLDQPHAVPHVGTVQLYRDGIAIAIDSAEESYWLDRIESAAIEIVSPAIDLDAHGGASPDAIILSPDIGEYLDAIDISPNVALRVLVHQFLERARAVTKAGVSS